MAWRRPGEKPLSELMMACLLTHICVTRPQWVKAWKPSQPARKLQTRPLCYCSPLESASFVSLQLDEGVSFVMTFILLLIRHKQDDKQRGHFEVTRLSVIPWAMTHARGFEQCLGMWADWTVSEEHDNLVGLDCISTSRSCEWTLKARRGALEIAPRRLTFQARKPNGSLERTRYQLFGTQFQTSETSGKSAYLDGRQDYTAARLWLYEIDWCRWLMPVITLSWFLYCNMLCPYLAINLKISFRLPFHCIIRIFDSQIALHFIDRISCILMMY